jgi:peroxiredoxin
MENGSPGPLGPLAPGERAPDFSLPAVDREGLVSLADYTGRTPLLLALFRGLWCPFCRKAIANLGRSATSLRARGVESLAVVATTPENARLYFRFRPTAVPLAADPELATHRLFRLPMGPPGEDVLQAIAEVPVNPTGELPEPLPMAQAGPLMDRLEGFRATPVDESESYSQFGLLKGQFLLDAQGIVRWANIECAQEGFMGIGKFPTEQELLAALDSLRS